MFRIIDIPFCTKSTTTTSAAANQWIPLDIIQTHILNRLDGATLACISCASSQLLSLCSEDQLWRNICNSTWPSTTDSRVFNAISAFASAHRSFYLDSFPSMHHQLTKKARLSDTLKLLSAVDICFKDQVIHSKVLETETAGDWFLNHPLVIQLLGPTEMVPTPLGFEGDRRTCMSLAKEHLKVSWIVIDPNNKRAVNIASHEAVDSRIQWYNGGDDIALRYATVAAADIGKLVQFSVLFTCSRGETGKLHVKQVKMHIEDMEKKTLSGRESVRILQAAMDGRRRRIDIKMERDNYEIFSDMELYERKMRDWESDAGLILYFELVKIGGICFTLWEIYDYLVGRKKTSDFVTTILGETLMILLAESASRYLLNTIRDSLTMEEVEINQRLLLFGAST